ncbi:hypothetical protein GCWU000325_00822 [Alloprevotella tannerae ATCC 51259]|uniref:Uncharacterized protein n=1 Tax=Alloprevotella tannerae ATCC 51259 TaxID=626522 RepID=C9LF40_9BACT|nr:hypothetical protein GCWU000325_00822 [Alloprevotella tannerae ATCC 51259]
MGLNCGCKDRAKFLLAKSFDSFFCDKRLFSPIWGVTGLNLGGASRLAGCFYGAKIAF